MTNLPIGDADAAIVTPFHAHAYGEGGDEAPEGFMDTDGTESEGRGQSPGWLREATQLERTTNGWPAGTVLIEAPRLPVQDLDEVRLPIPGPSWLNLSASHVQTFNMTIVESQHEGMASARDETFNEWRLSSGSMTARLILSSVQGYYVKGAAGNDSFTVRPWEPAWILEETASPPPSGETPAVMVWSLGDGVNPYAGLDATPTPAAAAAVPGPWNTIAGLLGQCNVKLLGAAVCQAIYPECADGVDNDGDRWNGYPDDPGCTNFEDDQELESKLSYRFGLVGEMKWCTQNVYSWTSLLASTGTDIRNAFLGNGGTHVSLTQSMSHCFLAGNMATANNCDSGASTCPSYPFNGCNKRSPCYINNIAAAVAQARTTTSIPALKLVQVQHLEAPYQYLTGTTLVCGLSYLDNSGRSISIGEWFTDPNCPDYVWSHEVGHLYDAEHADAVNIGGCWTVMRDALVCKHNYFSDANRRNVNTCTASSVCPKSGTF